MGKNSSAGRAVNQCRLILLSSWLTARILRTNTQPRKKKVMRSSTILNGKDDVCWCGRKIGDHTIEELGQGHTAK